METTSSDSVTSSDDLKNEEPKASAQKKVPVAGFDSTFGTKTWREDTTLIVEGKHLYVSSSILSILSPVFTQMFEENMNESGPMEIELDGKKYDDILEFLKCIYPNIMKNISLENVFVVLPLAVEFGIEQLPKRCENIVTQSISDQTSSKNVYMYLSKALEFNLIDLRKKCIKVASKKSFKDLQEAGTNCPMSVEMKYEIQCGILESLSEQLSNVNKEINSVSLNKFLNEGMDPSTLKNPRIVYLEYTFNIQEHKYSRKSPNTIAHGIAWSISIETPRNGSLGLYLVAKSSTERSREKDWACRVSGSMCLCNNLSYRDINNPINTELTNSETVHGYYELIKMETVLDEYEGFINDGKIRVELYLLVEEPTFED